MSKLEILEAILSPVVEGLSYECWGIEYISQGKHSVLRVYIDKPDGITLDDCTLVSRQLSAVLDVEDPITTEYTLEVSSPGVDRPLLKLAHFEQFAGHNVQLRLKMPFEGKRKYSGIIKGIEGEDVVLVVGEHELLLPIESIDKANIVPQFD